MYSKTVYDSMEIFFLIGTRATTWLWQAITAKSFSQRKLNEIFVQPISDLFFSWEEPRYAKNNMVILR